MNPDLIISYDTVLFVIQEINRHFPLVMNKYFPNSPHRDPLNYYLTGSCAYYADILYAVFQDYANYCYGKSHALVKIGNMFYDVAGMNLQPFDYPNSYEIFSEADNPYYYSIVDIELGRSDPTIDNTITPILINIGKEALANYLSQKEVQKNTLS